MIHPNTPFLTFDPGIFIGLVILAMIVAAYFVRKNRNK